MDQDHQERIRQRAHEIWESEGRPEGRDSDHWSRAEEELRHQTGNGDSSGDGARSGENDQTSQAQPDAADAMAPKPAKRPRKTAAKSGNSADSEPAPFMNDGP